MKLLITDTQLPHTVSCVLHVWRLCDQQQTSACVPGTKTQHLRVALVRLLSRVHTLFALYTRRAITCWKGPVYVALSGSAAAAALSYLPAAAALHEQQQIEGGIEIRATRVRHAFTDSAGVEAAKTRDFVADELGPCARDPLSAYTPQKRLPASSDRTFQGGD